MFASEIHDTPAGSVRHADESRGDWAKIRFADLVAMLGISIPDEHRFIDVTFPVRRVKAGEALHRSGDEFKAIYVVRSGFFKTVSIDTTGAELVLGFPMGGDVVGLDGVDAGHYLADVIALDISSVAVIPFAQLSQLAREFPCVEKLMYSLFSRELVHKHAMFWLLGTLSAEARVASFLLELSERFHRLGYSRTSFALRATRQEIGSYLGLKLETVSRTFSAFAAHGLMDIDRRQVTLRDLDGLKRVVAPNAASSEDDTGAPPAHRLPAARPFAVKRAPGEASLAMAA